MNYCYYCGAWFSLEESSTGSLCICGNGYLFSVDIEQEDDLDISLETY